MESNAVLLPSPQHMSQVFAGLPDLFLNQQHTIDSMLLQQTRRRKILWERFPAVIEAFRSWSRSAPIPQIIQKKNRTRIRRNRQRRQNRRANAQPTHGLPHINRDLPLRRQFRVYL